MNNNARSNDNDNDDNNILITRFSSTNHHRIMNQSSSFVSKLPKASAFLETQTLRAS